MAVEQQLLLRVEHRSCVPCITPNCQIVETVIGQEEDSQDWSAAHILGSNVVMCYGRSVLLWSVNEKLVIFLM